MSRNVKGVLFADYVRMIRSQKEIDWSAHLSPEDLGYVFKTVEPAGWYPMEVFEHLGNAILKEVALDDFQAVRMWGRFSVDVLAASMPMLVAKNNPLETMMRFRVQRGTFFDFTALSMVTLVDDHAKIGIAYHMGAMAEEAASWQTMGFFERLLELAGATEVSAKFTQRAWFDAPETHLELQWTTP